MKQAPTVARGATWLFLAAAASAVLGVVREAVIARTFGAASGYDAYVLAQYVPSMVMSALMVGLPNVVPPLLEGIRHRLGEEAAAAFRGGFLLSWTVVLLVLHAILLLLVPTVSSWLTAGSQIDVSLVGSLQQVLLLANVLGVGFVALRAVSHAESRFLLPAGLLLLSNLAMITMVLAFAGIWHTRALAAGVLVASVLQTVGIVAAWSRNRSVTIRWKDPFSPAVRASFVAGLGVIGLELLWGLFYLLDGFLARSLPGGTVSVINYAVTLCRLPGLLIGFSLASALLPVLSRHAARGHDRSMGDQLAKALRITIVAGAVITWLWVRFGDVLVRLLFEAGAFDTTARLRTVELVSVLAATIIPHSVYPTLARAMNAFGRNRALVVAMSAALLVKLVVARTLLADFGAMALMFGTIASLLVLDTLLVGMLWKRLGRDAFNQPAVTLGLALAVAMGASVVGMAAGSVVELVVGGAAFILAFPRERALVRQALQSLMGRHQVT